MSAMKWIFGIITALLATAATAQTSEECYPGLGECGETSQMPDMKIDIGTPDDPVAPEPDISADSGTSQDQLVNNTGVSSNGDWFVIAGSFPLDSTDQAMERLQYLRDQGLAAELIETNRYPKLTNGLFAVVVASYSRSEAFRALEGVKGYVPDAYVKKGD
ncbi:hypothetical protein [Roseovarius sp. E0-M6]|uniref:hypothetical protein n=1 Tax=Roseovarius sp. E0-M6 TaxID=3127118 RepID=UPI00300FB759